MKNKTMIALVLTAIMTANAFAQQYASEKDFEIEKEGNGITITKYTGKGGAVNIPSKIQNLPITSIGVYAFLGCSNLTSVTIPNNVTRVHTPLLSIAL
jgi:hypothetical protein